MHTYTPIILNCAVLCYAGIEGLGGDKRFNTPPGASGIGLLTKLQRDAGSRLVVVPYFVDRIEHIRAVLEAENYTMEEAVGADQLSSASSSSAPSSSSSTEKKARTSGLVKAVTKASASSSSSSPSSVVDRPIKYYMRADADKGHALRADIVRTFQRVDGAVVDFGKLEDTAATTTTTATTATTATTTTTMTTSNNNSSSSSSSSSGGGRRQQQQQAYMHYLELQHALFCLAPKGLTSSAAR